MEVSGEVHTPAALPLQKFPHVDCIGSWVGPKVAFHAVSKRKTPVRAVDTRRTPICPDLPDASQSESFVLVRCNSWLEVVVSLRFRWVPACDRSLTDGLRRWCALLWTDNRLRMTRVSVFFALRMAVNAGDLHVRVTMSMSKSCSMSGAAYPRRGDCVGLCSNLRCGGSLFDTHPSGSGDWSCSELHALCPNSRTVGRAHKSFLYNTKRMTFHCVEITPTFCFHGAVDSLMSVILCIKGYPESELWVPQWAGSCVTLLVFGRCHFESRAGHGVTECFVVFLTPKKYTYGGMLP
jgi:hypothetical protein